MNELVIRIRENGAVAVEEHNDGAKSFKAITPDSLLSCINASLLRGSVSSGLLPRGCLSYTSYDSGERDIVLLHQENRANISFLGTEYTNFPLPRLAFGFRISQEGRVSSCRLGVIANDDMIKPDTKMYHYPLSNVSGFALCTGNNQLPRCTSLHTLSSLPYLIMSAQIDHLALYAGAKGYPRINTLDPRHFRYIAGTAKTVESLSGKWASDTNYGVDLAKMVEGLRKTANTPLAPEDMLKILVDGSEINTPDYWIARLKDIQHFSGFVEKVFRKYEGA